MLIIIMNVEYFTTTLRKYSFFTTGVLFPLLLFTREYFFASSLQSAHAVSDIKGAFAPLTHNP